MMKVVLLRGFRTCDHHRPPDLAAGQVRTPMMKYLHLLYCGNRSYSGDKRFEIFHTFENGKYYKSFSNQPKTTSNIDFFSLSLLDPRNKLMRILILLFCLHFLQLMVISSSAAEFLFTVLLPLATLLSLASGSGSGLSASLMMVGGSWEKVTAFLFRVLALAGLGGADRTTV